MSIKQVKDYFKQYDMDTRIQEFSVSSATVDLAASALGCEPERIAKTLSFLVNGQAILIVTSGDAKVDNKKNSRNILKQKLKCFLLMRSLTWSVMKLAEYVLLL
ncbi:hypothetical protein BsIDN1_11620 [Bacillus safensis]|uniref:YbaK/aminoacyl-tRNA synthetase-associated domain-containing protein n=1 Tax=Bacillus safensis TaxID=561879 RepID=A0A5S9M5V9_BACIA|nr:hypothetical protein BsIDN1_11620 [Bacillus safensis]